MASMIDQNKFHLKLTELENTYHKAYDVATKVGTFTEEVVTLKYIVLFINDLIAAVEMSTPDTVDHITPDQA